MLTRKKMILIIIVLILSVFVGSSLILTNRSTLLSSNAYPSFYSFFFSQEPKKPEPSSDLPVTPPIKTETIYSIVSVSGEVIDRFGTAHCTVPDVTSPWGAIQLTTGAIVSPVAAKAPTHEPAWLVMQIQTDQPINTLRFNWRFAAGGEGLLRVFVNENLVRDIDQRFVPAVSPEPLSVYVGDLAPGTYKIAFRLDGYGANPSGVELTGIELGQKTIKFLH